MKVEANSRFVTVILYPLPPPLYATTYVVRRMLGPVNTEVDGGVTVCGRHHRYVNWVNSSLHPPWSPNRVPA